MNYKAALVILSLMLPYLVTEAAEFVSDWPKDIERVWVGPEYWSNRLQDWRTAGGRLECVTSGGDRNVHLLTRQLGRTEGNFRMSVRLGSLVKGRLSSGWAGFRIGVKGVWNDYRDSVHRGKGLDAGITTTGRLFIGDPKIAQRLRHYGIPRDNWKIHYVDSEETEGGDSRAKNIFDGRPETIWHTRWRTKKVPYPHEIQIDLGKSYTICGFCYLPRQLQVIGRIKDYEFYISDDGKEWGKPVAKGKFSNSPDLQEVRFDEKQCRYVRLVAKSGILNRPACVIAEFYVLDRATVNKAAKPKPKQANLLPLNDIELRLTAKPIGENYRIILTANEPKSGKELARVRRDKIAPEQLVGNLVLVCDARTGRIMRRTQRAGGNVRFWFRDWRISGSKVEAHDDRAFGPIFWTQYTLSNGVLKMTAMMPPIGEKDNQSVRMQIKRRGDWTTISESKIDKLSRTATFRIENWDASHDIPYRVAYTLRGTDDKIRDYFWSGTIRRDPVDKETIIVAAFTGNADYAFPNNDIVKHVKAHDPDVLFFSGDNIYENVGGYGTQRSPLGKACLDYLRKWYFFGWAFGELMRDRPCISIPDDHDVYQGNLWGNGGRKTKRINAGGYVMPAEWVNMVERTQTSNLPDPYDPVPVEQGIGVYYTAMTYGRISFAILEDRKFKTGPEGLVPKTGSRSDHVDKQGFDPKAADVPGAKLLGNRQLKFLRDWASDWRGTEMKVALSQTTFCNVATLHGGGRKRLVADYDSNGWPQTGRNKALRELRRCFAFHICGDQHLATIVHHGIDTWNDACWAFCVPSICNFYPRAWVPLKPAHNWKKGMIEYTGEFRDGFGNYITVWAHTNPRPMGREPAWLYDNMPGYGIVRFNKKTRKITIECWPRFADPKDSKTGGQYEGWPKTIDQLDNYGRKAAAYLPMIKVTGMADPVVQIIDESNNDIVYTLRIKGTSFRPKVFKSGTYTVKVGEQGTPRMKTFKNVRSMGIRTAETIEIRF